MPCMDANECNASTTILFTASLTHYAMQHGDGNCSPFCSCACCGSYFSPNFLIQKIAADKLTEKEKKKIFYSGALLPIDFFGNIWQPPKFG